MNVLVESRMGKIKGANERRESWVAECQHGLEKEE